MRPPFPPVLDATMLSDFRSCPRRFYLKYMEHWRPKDPSIHLVAGGAFAKGLEACRLAFYEEGFPAEEAEAIGGAALLEAYGDFQPADRDTKTLDRVLGAFEYFLWAFPLQSDDFSPLKIPGGRSGVEFSFLEPLEILHPASGEPLLYSGRADMIGHYASGIYIEDDKTTSSLGAQWQRQWEMRSQFTGYCWAARKLGLSPSGALIRGVSILKTKYDHAQVLTNRLPWELDRWEEQLYRDIKRMLQCWEEGYWDYSLDMACVEYGTCTFTQVCKSADPAPWLKVGFEQRVWDPIGRREITPTEWAGIWG